MSLYIWWFPKIMGSFFGPPNRRDFNLRVYFGDLLFEGKYHIGLSTSVDHFVRV